MAMPPARGQKVLKIRALFLEEAKNLRFRAKGRRGCANCREVGREVMMTWRWSSQETEAENAQGERAQARGTRRRIEKR